MRILISGVSSARQPTGICRHAANLALALAATQEVSRVILLVGRWQHSYFRTAFNLQHSKLELVAAGIGQNSWARNLWYERTLPRIAREVRADVVHLSFPVPISQKRFSCPVVSSLHDLYPYDAPANFGSARAVFNRLFLRRCVSQSDFVACSSDFTLGRLRACLARLAVGKSARIYPIGVLNPGASHMTESLGRYGQRFLLAVAQHRRNKNLHLLIDAFAELRSSRPDCGDLRLLIVGSDGPETDSLHDQVRRESLSEHVTFAKELADEELRELYRHCEAVVVCSTIEGFCLPVVEAQQCGARVICSEIPVLREVGGVACRFFSLTARNPVSELAGAIASALRTPKPEPRTIHRFSPVEIARQHVALYRTLLSGEAEATISAGLDAAAVTPRKYAI